MKGLIATMAAGITTIALELLISNISFSAADMIRLLDSPTTINDKVSDAPKDNDFTDTGIEPEKFSESQLARLIRKGYKDKTNKDAIFNLYVLNLEVYPEDKAKEIYAVSTNDQSDSNYQKAVKLLKGFEILRYGGVSIQNLKDKYNDKPFNKSYMSVFKFETVKDDHSEYLLTTMYIVKGKDKSGKETLNGDKWVLGNGKWTEIKLVK